MMGKNIVLCSDGTGNRGGKRLGTNVWKVYKHVDRNRSGKTQITFYDDGVGTEENKYLKLFTGAFGVGFTRNVKDLYKFLIKNYEVGDDIYLFGFSRGAYTVRAFAAFISVCGLIDKGKFKTEEELDNLIDQAVHAYAQRRECPKVAKDFKKRWGNKLQDETGVNLAEGEEPEYAIPIKFIGVWDTVSAIGLPFDIPFKDWIFRHVFKFQFKDRVLGRNVEYAYQALALDDERKTFHPELWYESNDPSKCVPGQTIEQAWFAGMHSDVGGGYDRQGSAFVALEWLITKANAAGLRFDPGYWGEVRHHANPTNKIHDSRSGFAGYYRYEPRNIVELFNKDAGKERTPRLQESEMRVRIHDSVFDRLERRPLGYSTGAIPDDDAVDIEVVTTGRPQGWVQRTITNIAGLQRRVAAYKSPARTILVRAERYVTTRKLLHLGLVLLTLLAGAALADFAVASAADGKFAPGTWEDFFTKLPVRTFLVVVVIPLMMVYIPSLAAWVLCVLVIIVSVALAVAPPWILGGVWEPSWVDGVVAFVFPELLERPILHFVSHYPLGALAVIVLLLVMWVLRQRARRRVWRSYEEACAPLRR